MRVTGKPHSTETVSEVKVVERNEDTDLKVYQKPTTSKRRSRNSSLTRFKRAGGSRSRPDTPLLKWKTEDVVPEQNSAGLDGDGEDDETDKETRRRTRRKCARKVSARKLAAELWRLQMPEVVEGSGEERRRRDRLGFQPGACLGAPFLYHRSDSEAEDSLQSPRSVVGAKNESFCKRKPSIQFSNSAMEGATKWDHVFSSTGNEVRQIHTEVKRKDMQVSAVSVVSALEAELEQARARIEELETERRSHKKKLEHFLRKVSEERVAWRSREHEKVRVFIDDLKADLIREKKNCRRLEIVNSKLVNELADAKLSAKRCMQDYEKEMKARELIEEVCDELANEIGEDKAEVEALKRESMKLREEVEEERKMLQMAEVWREERVQMKLVDAKVALENKYSQMNKLVANLETFLRPKSVSPNAKEMREAELLQQAAASITIEDSKAFSYEPPKSGDIFSVFEDMDFGEGNEREIEPSVGGYSSTSHASKVHTVSPEAEVNKGSFHRHSNAYIDKNGDIDEDESGWETVSHVDDQCSSYSRDESIPSVNKNHHCGRYVSESGTEWEEDGCEEMAITEISEVCSVPSRQSRKIPSISKLWRSGPNNNLENLKIISLEGMNGRLSNARKSSVGIMSPDRGSGKGLSPSDLVGQWSSPESGNPHIARGMKGCIEWPRVSQKNSLKAKLLEARMESQKVQLRQVLKQKI